MTRLCIGLLSLCSLSAFGQTSPAAGARDLYFGGFDNAAPANKKPATTPPAAGRKPASTGPNTTVRNVAEPTGTLGLRYAIIKVDGASKQEVPASTRFQAGDRIQIKIQSNSDGYLYIVSQGTSGNWQVLFPSKSRASNRIRAGEDYTLPNNSSMRFAGQPGVEKLFVVLSRTPESDLDSVIYNLKNNRGKDEPTQIASNTVSDPLVAKLRSSSTRDLVLEESGGGGAPAAAAEAAPVEKATYIVSRNRGLDARIVADIRLTHE